jgi:hypothetical protein
MSLSAPTESLTEAFDAVVPERAERSERGEGHVAVVQGHVFAAISGDGFLLRLPSTDSKNVFGQDAAAFQELDGASMTVVPERYLGDAESGLQFWCERAYAYVASLPA